MKYLISILATLTCFLSSCSRESAKSDDTIHEIRLTTITVDAYYESLKRFERSTILVPVTLDVKNTVFDPDMRSSFTSYVITKNTASKVTPWLDFRGFVGAMNAEQLKDWHEGKNFMVVSIR